jgi:hypothetical protein
MSSKIIAGNATNLGVVASGATDGILELQTGSTPTTAVTIDTSQNVGIGTSTVGTFYGKTVEISNANDCALKFTNAQTGYTSSDGTYIGLLNSAATDLYLNNRESGNMLFQTSNTERMRITSGGVLALNTTTTGGSTPGQQIIYYAQNTNWGMFINNTLNNSGSYAIGFGSGGNLVGRCETTASSTSYVTSSDYRLKENIAPMTGALAKVALLKPCTYTWKIDNTPSQGFIAHELQAVVPEAVNGEKNAVNEDGSIKPQGVDTSFLVATLTAAIQELNAKVEAQAAEIQALKGVA